MIALTVRSYNGQPAEGPSARFDELGGGIGRAESNLLVLPDPERTISREHAQVRFRNGGFVIVDNGRNPVRVNGQVLPHGVERPIAPGDDIEIGGYRLHVADAASVLRPDDPFADLFGSDAAGLATGLAASPPAPRPSAMHAWPSQAAAAAPPSGPGVIPDDWDPFAVDAPASSSLAAPPPMSLPPAAAPRESAPPAGGGADSLDALFGLAGGPPASDPLGLARPPTPPAPRLELGSELNTPMPLPQRAVFSWDRPAAAEASRTVIVPKAGAAAPAARAAAAPPTPPRPQASAAAMPRAGDDALLAALLEGLGVPGLRLESLTPERMQLLGTLLREATRGAVELLVARALFKRELRAEMTMIAARENNPLKFSPNVETALTHLLGPPVAGFMPPGPAMRDAFDDLRAHQLGVMAGMRAALEGVLARFDPAQLEGKLARRSAIDSLIPATRKARLWEAFTELFGQLQGEAQDDFDELFGKAFLRAYQAQLERIDAEGRGGRQP